MDGKLGRLGDLGVYEEVGGFFGGEAEGRNEDRSGDCGAYVPSGMSTYCSCRANAGVGRGAAAAVTSKALVRPGGGGGGLRSASPCAERERERERERDGVVLCCVLYCVMYI